MDVCCDGMYVCMYAVMVCIDVCMHVCICVCIFVHVNIYLCLSTFFVQRRLLWKMQLGPQQILPRGLQVMTVGQAVFSRRSSATCNSLSVMCTFVWRMDRVTMRYVMGRLRWLWFCLFSGCFILLFPASASSCRVMLSFRNVIVVVVLDARFSPFFFNFISFWARNDLRSSEYRAFFSSFCLVSYRTLFPWDLG